MTKYARAHMGLKERVRAAVRKRFREIKSDERRPSEDVTPSAARCGDAHQAAQVTEPHMGTPLG